MRRKKRHSLYLILAILSLISLLLIIFLISPTSSLNLGIFKLSMVWIFFIPVVVFFFSLPTFLLKSKKHGILTAAFVTAYLVFRLAGLTHPLFLILLMGLFLTLELLFTSNRV